MDIKEMQSRKAALEDAISTLINDFCNQYGVVIWRVDSSPYEITQMQDSERRYYNKVSIDVRL